MGRFINLQSLFGWYSSSPINLTKAELKRKVGPNWMDMLNGGSGGGSARSFSDLLKPSSNPVDRQSDMETMMESDIGRPIIDTYAEEASQIDVNKHKAVWYECNDSSIEDNLNEMLERIGTEDSIYSVFYEVAGKGNHWRRVLWNNEEGVTGLVAAKHQEIRRIWDPLSKRLLGFTWQGQQPSEEVIEGNENLFSPWSFIHFRNLLNPDSEYGVSLLDHLYPMFKRMQYGLNQMTLYRLHCMPNRHLFWMDSGTQDFTSMMEQMHMFESMMRQRTLVGQGGMLESRYDPPALDSMMFLPRRTDEKTEYQVLQGDKDVPDVYDLDYLAKCFYGGARVPKAYVGHGDDGSGLAQASLVSQDIRFARMIRVLRRPVIYGYWQLACIHLALLGKNPKDYNIKVRMSKISALEEEVNAATLEKQMNMASSIVGICKDLEVPNRETMELVFKEYLHVPRQFIDIVKLAMSVTAASGGNDSSGAMFGAMGGGGGGGFGDMGAGLDDELPGEEKGPEPDESELPPVEARKVIGQVLMESLDSIRDAAKKLHESGSNKQLTATVSKHLREFHQHVGELQSLRSSKKASLTESIEESVGKLAIVSWPVPSPALKVLGESAVGSQRIVPETTIDESVLKAQAFKSEKAVLAEEVVNPAVKMVMEERKSRVRVKRRQPVRTGRSEVDLVTRARDARLD